MLYSTWQYLVEDVCSHNQIYVAFVAHQIITFLLFGFLSNIVLFVDYFQWPHFLYRYKIQKNQTLNYPKYSKTGWYCFYQYFYVQLPLNAAFVWMMFYRGCTFDNVNLPGYKEIIVHLIILFLFNELFFYYVHRLFHTKYMFQRFHRIHHEWRTPLPTVAVYTHPLESVLNFMAINAGILILGSHGLIWYIWGILSVIITAGDHSGYHFPLIHSPEFHDYHHYKVNECFGFLGILDWWHGTDNQFRKSDNFKRDHMLIGLKPLN